VTGYVVRRFAQAIVVMLIVSVIMFILLHALPGGLIRAQLGPKATATEVQSLTRTEGLDKPLVVQFWTWLWNALHGNLGFSHVMNQPVSQLLAEYLPRTLLLVGSSSVLTVALSIPIGMWQGMRRNKLDDHAMSAVLLVFYAMPDFLIGALGIILLTYDVRLLPSNATNYGQGFGTDLRDLLLPVGVLVLGNFTYYTRYMRSSVIDNLLEDYVRTARAVGNPPWRVMSRHVLRNAMSSTVTNIGLTLPFIFSGSLIIENLFNFPGLGALYWNAQQSRDFPVLLGIVLVITAAVIAGSLIADVLYAWLDPRVRYVRT
jgi:peptide/nickel transport system permease protein